MVIINHSGLRSIVSEKYGQELIDKYGFNRVTYFNEYNPDSKRIFVTRDLGGLGDMICILPVIQHFHKLGYKIDISVPVQYRVLFEGYQNKFYLETDIKDIDRQNYKYWLEMFCAAGDYEGEVDFRITKSRIQNFCDVIPDCKPCQPEFKKIKKKTNKGYIVISLKSKNRVKDWPEESCIELCKKLKKKKIYIVDDREKLNYKRTGIISKNNLDIKKLINLVSYADLVISLDTGLLHIAAALGVNCLGLFGPTNGKSTVEYYPTVEYISVKNTTRNCFQPCYYNIKHNNCKCRGFIGHCMKDITPDMVYNKLKELKWL